MTTQEIIFFFNVTELPQNLNNDELIIELLKMKFGFPINYTPEDMDEALPITEEENLKIYEKYKNGILSNEYENISLLANQLTRDLDEMYDKFLDS